MNDWSSEEQELLSKLPRETAPPPELEDRVLTAIFRPRRSAARIFTATAAAVVLVVLGFFAGRSTVAPSTPQQSGPAYVLLLRRSGTTSPQQVADYRAWAAGARKNGVLTGGAKLTTDGRIVNPNRQVNDQSFDRDGEVGGFFIVRAADLEEATRVALETPHIRYGGTIELRPVDQ